jgi:hypothetical protein
MSNAVTGPVISSHCPLTTAFHKLLKPSHLFSSIACAYEGYRSLAESGISSGGSGGSLA